MSTRLKKVHYNFSKDQPVCGVRGKIYITSEKFCVNCKACLRFILDVRKMILEDDESYKGLIKEVNIGQHWREKKPRKGE